MQAHDQRARRGRGRLRPADFIIVCHGFSSLCYGMVFPYTAIYLAGKPAVGIGGVVAYYAFSGSANLAVALLLTTGWIKLPKVALGVLGNGLWLAGYLTLSVAGSYPLVIAAAVAIGAGQGCFMAAVIPILNSLIAPADRRRVFGRRYAILNATLAAGALIAGTLIAFTSDRVISYFFVVNAIGIIPLMLALLGSRKHQQALPDPAGAATTASDVGAMPILSLFKLALPAAVFQLTVYLFGYSQFEATAPLVTEKLMHLPLFSVSLMLVVNVLVIISVQRMATRLLERRTEVMGLRIGVSLWAAGYCLVGLLAFAPHAIRLGGLLCYAVMFALGECAYSCSYYPWLISMVPDSELGRANALANSMMGIGTFVGPSIGVALILSGSAPVVWLSLAGCCFAMVLYTRLAAGTRRSAVVAPVS